MKQSQRGATVVELVVVVVYLAIVVSSTFYGGLAHGWPGVLLGLALGMGIPMVFIALLIWSEKWIWVGVPSLPTCSNGQCHAEDYRVEAQGGDLVYICRCGMRFRKKRRRFFEEDEDGSEQPYLVWRSFRGWFPEAEPSHALRGAPTSRAAERPAVRRRRIPEE
jgi:hypothetical protein